MSESNDVKSVIKWISIAVLAAIPFYLIVKKLTKQAELSDPSDIFAEEI